MLWQERCFVLKIVFQSLSSGWVVIRNIIDDRQEIGAGRFFPFKNGHDASD